MATAHSDDPETGPELDDPAGGTSGVLTTATTGRTVRKRARSRRGVVPPVDADAAADDVMAPVDRLDELQGPDIDPLAADEAEMARAFWGETVEELDEDVESRAEPEPEPEPEREREPEATPRPARAPLFVRAPAAAPIGSRRARVHDLVVRRVSPWSVLKVALVLMVALWGSLLVAGVILWGAADQAGLIENAENFVAKATGNETVDWDGGEVLGSFVAIGAVGIVAGTLLSGLLAVLFNLVSDLTGGVRLEMARLEPSRRSRPQQR